MHTEDSIHRTLFEKAIFHHAFCATAAFFGRLEDHVDSAIEVAVLCQVMRRAEQHRRVTVMTAGVHLAGMARGVIEDVRFLHRQRIHVGAQADGARTGTAFDDADNAGDTKAEDHRDAPLSKFFCHHIGGALLFIRKFRVRVDVAPDLLQLAVEREDRID